MNVVLNRMRQRIVAGFRVLPLTAACLSVAAVALPVPDVVAADPPAHGLSKYGDLKYGPDFEHFDYASPNAVKGGSVTQASLGTYDNLNPFILKGVSAAGATSIYDTLTVNSLDEAFSVYGLLAESIEVPEDKRWVTFRLRKEARWHDGVALTADDVVWTFNTIKSEGHPAYKSYYSAVVKAEALDSHTVKFSFSEGNNGELPLIIGQLAILPKHYWEGREFGKTTLEPPLGSGPYRVGKVDPGRSISYERVSDYWGRNLPVKTGMDNFDTLRYDYYRDLTVAHEALKAGDIDFKIEYISKNWATGYDFPALNDGKVVQELIPDRSIQRMQAFVLNSRKEQFSDPRVREALGYAFDFEWMNKNLFYGAYSRLQSYFQNSEFMATGLPEGKELELLEEFRDQLPEDVFTEAFATPKTDGSGNLRTQYRAALKLFKAAGYAVKDGKMTHLESGTPFTMELIIAQPSVEKIGLAYKKTLERLGVDLKVRVIDSAQYEKRVEDFDYDILVLGWSQSLSPGNEQLSYWGSAAASEPGSSNYAGINNPVIDELIKRIIAAPTRDSLVTATKALDRVLLHNHYVIPQYYGAFYRTAYWNKFSRPDIVPNNALGFSTWWVDPDKEAALQ